MAPTGPGWLLALKEGQTHFGRSPTIETGNCNLLAVARLTHMGKKTTHKHGHRLLFTVQIITYKEEPKSWHFSEENTKICGAGPALLPGTNLELAGLTFSASSQRKGVIRSC